MLTRIHFAAALFAPYSASAIPRMLSPATCPSSAMRSVRFPSLVTSSLVKAAPALHRLKSRTHRNVPASRCIVTHNCSVLAAIE